MTVLVGGRGAHPEDRTYRTSHPVRHDEVVLTVREDDESDATPLLRSRWSWPMAPRTVPRELRCDLLRARAMLAPPARGAGMATLVTSRGMESVMELLMPHHDYEHFPLCLGGRVERYVQIVPAHDEHLVHRGFGAIEPFESQPSRVDLDALERTLDLAGA